MSIALVKAFKPPSIGSASEVAEATSTLLPLSPSDDILRGSSSPLLSTDFYMLSRRILTKCIVTLSSVVLAGITAVAQEAPEKKPVFSKSTFDLGIVVSDLDKAAKFYKDVVGMTEVKGFAAPANVATSFGLTDNQPVVVRRFVMADVKDAPSLKLMAFPDAKGAKPDQRFIHSTLGFSYLTLFVNDMDAAVERAKKAKVELLGKTPAKVGGNNYLTVYKDLDGNFIELIGPSVKNAPKPNNASAAFFDAARTGNVAALQRHLANGQDIDAKQNGNVHAIGLAALFGHVEAVEFLIKKGADVDQQTKDGGTALHGASFLGRTKVVEALLMAGANVNIRNNNGITPLDECSEPWNGEISKKVEFLNRAIKVNVKAKDVESGRPIVLKLLKGHASKSSPDSK